MYFQAEHPGIALTVIKTGPLSAEENISLDAVLAALMRGREYSWLQYQDGAIDERQWRSEFLVTVSVMDSDRTRKWWSMLGRGTFNEDFIGFVESEILSVPVTENGWNVFAEWANR